MSLPTFHPDDHGSLVVRVLRQEQAAAEGPVRLTLLVNAIASEIAGAPVTVTKDDTFYKNVSTWLKAMSEANPDLFLREKRPPSSVFYSYVAEPPAPEHLAPLADDDEVEDAVVVGEATGVAVVPRRPATEALVKTPEAEVEAARAALVAWAQDQVDSIPDDLTEEEGMDLLYRINLRGDLHDDATLIMRFLMGVIGVKMRAAGLGTKGSGLTDKLQERFGVHKTTLRYCMNWASLYECDVRRMQEFLRAGGYKKRWHHIVELCQLHPDPAIMTPEQIADDVIRSIENQAARIERIAGQDGGEGGAEVLGASIRTTAQHIVPHRDDPYESDGSTEANDAPMPLVPPSLVAIVIEAVDAGEFTPRQVEMLRRILASNPLLRRFSNS